MARQGLMDDTGYHGFDDAELMAEKYCMRCKHLPIEIDANGIEYALNCDKDCSLSGPSCFDEME